jgi:hypothetical protein
MRRPHKSKDPEYKASAHRIDNVKLRQAGISHPQKKVTAKKGDRQGDYLHIHGSKVIVLSVTFFSLKPRCSLWPQNPFFKSRIRTNRGVEVEAVNAMPNSIDVTDYYDSPVATPPDHWP